MVLYDPRRTWGPRGICRPEDDHLFFAGGDGHAAGESTKKAWSLAKEICAMCPVLSECRRDTLGELEGVWGGRDPLERRNEREKLKKAIDTWPEELRLQWAQEIHGLRTSGLKWAEIQQSTGMPPGVAERLWGLWNDRIQKQPKPVKAVVDLPLPEPKEERSAFPDRPGQRDAWVRNNGLIRDAWYRGETPDRKWVHLNCFSGRGQVNKWFPAEDVKLYRPVAAVILNYRARPDAPEVLDATG
jgi:hypothetical protein